MSVRIPLIALAALALAGCDLSPPKREPAAKSPAPAAAAPAVKSAKAPVQCCCNICPATTAPVAKVSSDDVAAAGDTRSRQAGAKAQTATRAVVRQAPKPQVRQERVYAGGYKPATRGPSIVTSERRDYASSRRREALAGGSHTRREEGRDGFEGYAERDSGRYQRERATTGRGYAETDGRRYEDSEGRRYSQQSTDRYQGEQRRYESAQSGYGGRYGVSGRSASGASIAVQETETSTQARSYRESSSSYGSSGYATSSASSAGYSHSQGLYYEDRDGRVRRAGPAGTDRAGFLTWPGKVEY